MFLQVSKISFAGFIIITLLFQQFDVGSGAFAATPDNNQIGGKDKGVTGNENTLAGKRIQPFFPDSIRNDSSITIIADTLIADSLVGDTNVSKDDVLKSQVKYHARDSMRVNMDDEVVYLYGAATVDYEEMHLKADYIVIDMNRKELYAEGVTDSTGKLGGTPEFSQADQQFRSNSIRYNFDTKRGKIAYVITKEGEGYIHGEVVKKDPENNFFIKNGQYTTCDLDTPHFAITSNRLKVISNNKIVTGPAYLTIEGVPTPLLIPFGFFPNKQGRSSGIIFPAYGESAQRGFYFQHLGYYFGFNDYFNLALTSDVYTKGSYTLDAATIYKKRYRYSGNLRLSYAYTVNSEKELPDFSVTKDFHVNWMHAQDAKQNPNSNFSANVNAGSTSYYRNTISSISNVQSNTLESSVNYSHTFPDKPMNLTVAVRHWQNTITKDIRITAPDLSYNVTRINPFKRKISIGSQRWYEKIGTSYSLRGTNFIETKDTLLFRNESLENMQNGFQHSIPLSTSFNVLSYFNLSPTFNYTERWYLKTRQYSYDSDSAKVDTFDVKKFTTARDYQASIGVSTRVYGMYQFRKGPIRAIRHVMTPVASLSYRPDFGKDKFGYYKTVVTDSTGRSRRYSIFQNNVYGGPASGPYANLGFSLDNNLEMKVRTKSDTGETVKKIKILESLRISSGYNLIADSMKLSLFNVSGRTSLFDRLSINFSGTLDPYAFDEKNVDYNKFLVSDGGRLVRLTGANLSMNFSLNSKANKESSKYSVEDMNYINQHPEEYVDFNIPYNLNVSYSYSYSKRGNLSPQKTQSANFAGDLSLTPKWKVGFNTWYDIKDGKFTSVSTNIYRDLHCWEMRMSWIPFGYLEGWNFQINVKASILQDLKLLKKKEFYER